MGCEPSAQQEENMIIIKRQSSAMVTLNEGWISTFSRTEHRKVAVLIISTLTYACDVMREWQSFHFRFISASSSCPDWRSPQTRLSPCEERQTQWLKHPYCSLDMILMGRPSEIAPTPGLRAREVSAYDRPSWAFFGSLRLPSNIHKFNFQSALLLLVWVLLNEIASS